MYIIRTRTYMNTHVYVTMQKTRPDISGSSICPIQWQRAGFELTTYNNHAAQSNNYYYFDMQNLKMVDLHFVKFE